MPSDERAVAICFVCTGNICRSPTAEGVMRALVGAVGLAERVLVDSAGTHSYHTGEQPDPRTVKTARGRGVTLVHAARTFTRLDFDRFDYVVALDRSHERTLSALAVSSAAHGRLSLLRSFEAGARDIDVPDPYYGEQAGFDEVFDICERACAGLLAHVRARHGL